MVTTMYAVGADRLTAVSLDNHAVRNHLRIGHNTTRRVRQNIAAKCEADDGDLSASVPYQTARPVIETREALPPATIMLFIQTISHGCR